MPDQANFQGLRTAVIDRHAAPPPVQRRQVTVLCCDMVGSTELSTRLDPEDLLQVIRDYLAFCERAVERHGGSVSKFTGDGLIACFGYPQAFEDAAERAVRVGREIASGVGTLRTRPDVTLQVRVGISTGLGVLGSHAPGEAPVIGTMPAIADRLQGIVPSGGVAIAEPTRHLLGFRFVLQDIGRHDLDGTGRLVQVWSVIGERTAPSRFQGNLARKSRRLIARDRELRLLSDCWDAAIGGAGRAAAISGLPGIGKSHLVAALCDQARRRPHTLIRLQCSTLHAGTALHPVIASLERAAGFRGEQGAAERMARLRRMLASYGPDADLGIFARLLSIPDAAPAAPEQSAAETKRQTLAALREWLARHARAKPTMLIVEDLHWADPTTLELVEGILSQVSGQRLLMLLTYRSEFQPPWAGSSAVTAIELSGLNGSESLAVVRNTDGETLPDAVVHRIVDRADGVPLFLQELTRSAMDWRSTAPPGAVEEQAFVLPTTLQDLLLARLGNLAVGREAVQIAAAIGREFDTGLLSRVSNLGQPALRAAIAELVDAGLVQQSTRVPETVFAFRHALIQEATYATLLHRRRREVHARIGSIIESEFPDIAATQPEVVAHHYTQAMMRDTAIAWWTRAAERSFRQSANQEAAQHYQRAIGLLPGLPDSAERDALEVSLRTALNAPLFVVLGPGSVAREDNLAVLFRLHQRRDDTRSLFATLYGYSVTAYGRAEFREAAGRMNEYLELAERTADPVVIAVGLMHRGHVEIHLGQIDAALADLDRAIALCRPEYLDRFTEEFSLDVRSFATGCLAIALQQHGDARRAAASAAAAIDQAEHRGHAGTLLMVGFLAAMQRMIAGDAPGVAAQAAHLEQLGKRHRGSYWRAHADLLGGWAMAREGHIDDGLARMRRGFAERERMQGRAWAAQYLAQEAELLGSAARCQEALQRLDEAQRLIDTTGQRVSAAEVHRQRARVVRRMGAPLEQTEALFRQALAIAREQGQGLYVSLIEAEL